MALQKIDGNQISNATAALITSLTFLNGDSVLQLPTGTTFQRPAGSSYGTIRFNTTIDSVEVWKSDADGQGTDGWGSVGGGGPSRGRDSIVRTNRNYVNENLTIGPSQGEQYTNGMSAGPVSINAGFTVTVDTGGTWSIV
jgi:hypothetical protein